MSLIQIGQTNSGMTQKTNQDYIAQMKTFSNAQRPSIKVCIQEKSYGSPFPHQIQKLGFWDMMPAKSSDHAAFGVPEKMRSSMYGRHNHFIPSFSSYPVHIRFRQGTRLTRHFSDGVKPERTSAGSSAAVDAKLEMKLVSWALVG